MAITTHKTTIGREWTVEGITVAAGLEEGTPADVIVADCHRTDTVTLSLPMGCDVAHMTPDQARRMGSLLFLAAERVAEAASRR